MNPYPFALLNHLTLPVIRILLACLTRHAAERAASTPWSHALRARQSTKKDRDTRSYFRRRPAQRQPATLDVIFGVVNIIVLWEMPKPQATRARARRGSVDVISSVCNMLSR